MVFNFSIIILIFLLGFNLGGVVYGQVYNYNTKHIKLASLIILILILLNITCKYVLM